MHHEKSCGALVLRRDAETGKAYILMIRHKNGGHRSFPKGHMERGETEYMTAIREVYEETGLTLTSYSFRGIVTFVSDRWETEYMHLFTADCFEGEPKKSEDCDEGNLEWVDIDKIPTLPLWAGDLIFLDLLAKNTPFFSLKLRYEGERLVESRMELGYRG